MPRATRNIPASIWPAEPTLDSFRVVMAGDYWYLEHFWHKFANSLFIALATMVLTVAIGSLASFALGRMRLARGWLLGNFPVVTYAVPASFLVIPFYRIMREYGLSDSLWAVIAADVTFAAPYAILILQQYARLIPLELDEAAQIDGASPFVVYRSIYLPLMAPALAAVGTFALLFAWNEYLYQYMLLTSDRNMTVAVAIAQFFDADEAPWNLHDGRRHRLCAAAGRDLPRAAPLDGRRVLARRREGLAAMAWRGPSCAG